MIRNTRPLSRRTLLRGAGAAMAVPFLEAMGPLGAFAQDPAVKAPVRMALLYMPNGVNPRMWTPEGEGREFKLSPLLEPLAKVKDDLLVFTELMNTATETGDGHYVKIGGWLTGTTITKTSGAELRSGNTSMDQAAAQKVGNLTPLPSLELGIEPVTTGVDTVVGYTRLYGSHLAWSSPTTPLAKEINPRLAFDRLFRRTREGKGPSAENKSVLDLVLEDAKALQDKVGTNDRKKLDEYLESVRAVEKRIDFDLGRRKREVEEDPEARKTVEALDGRIKDYYLDPAKLRQRGVDHTEHVRLMLDLMVLAFWSDATRVCTFLFGNEVSNKNFAFLEGVNGGHHQTSHHENNPQKMEEYRRINTWFVRQYGYMLERLKSIREGEGTLLDNSMVVFGSGIRDGNAHSPVNLPVVLGGKGGGTLRTGRHLVYPKRTPLCNLWLSMLKRMGCALDRFADSTGELKGLEA